MEYGKNISVFGSGYVGAPLAYSLASHGKNVTLVDPVKSKIDSYKNGISPIKDEGLQEFVEEYKDKLLFTTNVDEGIKKSDVLFLAVPTSPKENGELDISIIENISKRVAEIIENGEKKYIVVKSTVSVGTGDIVKELINSKLEKRFSDKTLPEKKYNEYIEYISNPEFLEEGQGLKQTLNPSRVVLGTESEEAKNLLINIYKSFGSPIVNTDVLTAEFIKLAANTQLATQISISNQMANLSRKLGIDYNGVMKGLFYDKRIGRFLDAGPGFGGYCFPKDSRDFFELGVKYGENLSLIGNSIEFNKLQKVMPVSILKEYISDLKGKKIAVWGTSFKKESDNITESPTIDLVKELTFSGVSEIKINDPFSMEKFKNDYSNDNIPTTFFEDRYDSLKGVDALIIMVNHNDYNYIDLEKIKENMTGNVIIDSRRVFTNNLSREDIEKNGLIYDGIGVPKKQK